MYTSVNYVIIGSDKWLVTYSEREHYWISVGLLLDACKLIHYVQISRKFGSKYKKKSFFDKICLKMESTDWILIGSGSNNAKYEHSDIMLCGKFDLL